MYVQIVHFLDFLPFLRDTVANEHRQHVVSLTFDLLCALCACVLLFRFSFYFFSSLIYFFASFWHAKNSFRMPNTANGRHTLTHNVEAARRTVVVVDTILSSRFESSVWNKKETDTFHYYLYFVVVVGFFVSFSFWIVSMCLCASAGAGWCMHCARV